MFARLLFLPNFLYFRKLVVKKLSVYNASALIGSSGHLIPSGLVLFCLEESIHIPYVLVGLTVRPNSF